MSEVVAISAERQITIPMEFFTLFNFGEQAKLTLLGNGILMQPANVDDANSDINRRRQELNRYMGNGEKTFYMDAQEYVRELRDCERNFQTLS